MNRFVPSQLLGLLLLLQATLEIRYPLSAFRSFGQFEAIAFGTGLLNLGAWTLLVASGIGLLLKKRWAVPCMFGFSALTPLAMLPSIPFVMRLLAPGHLSFLIGMAILNFLVVGVAFFLIRRESAAQAA